MSKNYLNVPNVLSFLRLLMVPMTVYLILKREVTWALFVFLLACVTDLIDGYIARRFKLITKLGIWLDPLADKLMAVCVLVSFVICRIIPLWVLMVLLAKELIMLLGGLLIMKNGFSTPSNKFGKAAAFIMNTTIASCFISNLTFWHPYYLYFVYFGLALSVLSMVQYALKNGRLLFTKADMKTEDDGSEREQ